MRDDRRQAPGTLAAVLLGTLLCASAGRAEGVYGTFQTQYQRVDDRETLVSGDGSLRTLVLEQELWLRTLDLHHQSFVRPDLLLDSNLRYSDQSFVGTGDVTRTPFGSLRLIHPWLQALASYQPASQTSSLSSQSGLNPDPITSRRVTTHNQESLISGHVAVPRWPQLDMSWIHRRRDGAGSVADQNTSRSFRYTFDRERWTTYGGVNDQALSSGIPGSGRNTQQVWSGGGSYHYLPRPSLSTNAQYDVSLVRGVASGIRRPSNVNHSGSVSGEWHASPKWLGTASYQVRHVDFGTPTNPPQTDHEGALIARFQLARRSSLTGGAGIRTVRNYLPEGGTSVGLQKYLTSVAALEGRVRRNWTMTSGLSHTTNFDPTRAAYHLETINTTSRGQLTRRIQVDGTAQFSANSDSGAVASRYGGAWTARVQGTPVRALQLSCSYRGQRSGSALWRAANTSRGLSVDATWKPTNTVQVLGQYGSNSARPAAAGGNSSRSLTARIQPSRQWQWYCSWTRSDQTTVISTAGQLSSQEVVSSRVQYERSRQLAMTAGVTYNDPGRAVESKRLDLTLSWSFGR